MENPIIGSDERVEQHLAEQARLQKVGRARGNPAKAFAKAYPGTVRIDSEASPQSAHQAADPRKVLTVCMSNAHDFEVSEKEKAKLREYAAQHKALMGVVMENTQEAVWQRYKATPPPPEGRVPRDQAEVSAMEVRRHAKRGINELPARYAALIQDLCARAGEDVELRLFGELDRFQSNCDQMGIPADDHAVIRALKGALGYIRERQREIESNPLNASLEIARIFVPDL